MHLQNWFLLRENFFKVYLALNFFKRFNFSGISKMWLSLLLISYWRWISRKFWNIKKRKVIIIQRKLDLGNFPSFQCLTCCSQNLKKKRGKLLMVGSQNSILKRIYFWQKIQFKISSFSWYKISLELLDQDYTVCLALWTSS